VRPWIGIVGELACVPASGREELRLSLRYSAAVERAGGLPVAVLPFDPERETRAGLNEILERLDGLLFTGGDDFDTARLGLGPTHSRARPVPARKQDFDLALARRALALRLPTLGICYGMQLLALCEEGNLYQHLPEDLPGVQEHAGGVRHAVELSPGAKLGRWLGVARLDVISRHHQAVSAVGGPWSIAALDGEGLIEAIERRDHPFAVGVQWHPELSGSPADEQLFSTLVQSAREHARHRSGAEVSA